MNELKINYLTGEKYTYDTTLQILINKELKKKAQSIALQKDESLSQVIRKALTTYVNEH